MYHYVFRLNIETVEFGLADWQLFGYNCNWERETEVSSEFF